MTTALGYLLAPRCPGSRDMNTLHRPWCAVIQFPGKKLMYFGTVWTESNEGEERVRQLINEKLSVHFSLLPEVIELVPGALVFKPWKS